jgi:CheY-like chemotaxis protein
MDPKLELKVNQEEEEHYWVSCLNCGELFDAASSPWCFCVTDSPTVLCSNCNTCFCTAGPKARIKFWQEAPSVMWRRRLRQFDREYPPPPSDLGNPLRRPLILVVDDEPDTRRIAFHVLDGLGYGVLLAEDGVSAFAMAKQYRPDLVLTDQIMPHMDGKHLAKTIKEDPDLKNTRVIVMSGLYKKESQRIEIIREYQADDFLMKPIAFEKLGEVLASWLSVKGE